MAEKKTTKKVAAPKKATKQAKPKAVDMTTPTTPADETGLELTEGRGQEVVEDEVKFSQNAEKDDNLADAQEVKDAETQDDADFDYTNYDKEIQPKESVVEAEKCEKGITDDHDAEACDEDERNQELDLNPEPAFKEDKDMVNDITNILNGLDGVRAKKITHDGEDEPKEEKKVEKHGSATTNTEEKNYYSEQFSRSWGGVMYDY